MGKSSIIRMCECMRSHAQTSDPLERGFLSLARWEFSPATTLRTAALPSKSTRSLSAYDAAEATAHRLAQRQPAWGITERHFRCSPGFDRSVPVRGVSAEAALGRISASAGPTEMPPASHSVYCGSAQRRRQPTKPTTRAPPEPYSDAAGRVVSFVRCVQLAARRMISGHQTSVSPPRPSGAGWIWFAGGRLAQTARECGAPPRRAARTPALRHGVVVTGAGNRGAVLTCPRHTLSRYVARRSPMAAIPYVRRAVREPDAESAPRSWPPLTTCIAHRGLHFTDNVRDCHLAGRHGVRRPSAATGIYRHARRWDDPQTTKSQLIQRIAHRQSLLAAGGRIEIRGFGSFSLHYRPGRAARNPRTGTPKRRARFGTLREAQTAG